MFSPHFQNRLQQCTVVNHHIVYKIWHNSSFIPKDYINSFPKWRISWWWTKFGSRFKPSALCGTNPELPVKTRTTFRPTLSHLTLRNFHIMQKLYDIWTKQVCWHKFTISFNLKPHPLSSCKHAYFSSVLSVCFWWLKMQIIIKNENHPHTVKQMKNSYCTTVTYCKTDLMSNGLLNLVELASFLLFYYNNSLSLSATMLQEICKGREVI